MRILEDKSYRSIHHRLFAWGPVERPKSSLGRVAGKPHFKQGGELLAKTTATSIADDRYRTPSLSGHTVNGSRHRAGHQTQKNMKTIEEGSESRLSSTAPGIWNAEGHVHSGNVEP